MPILWKILPHLWGGLKMKFKRCPVCDTILVSLYCRDGAGGKVWLKIDDKYCKVCKKTIKL